MSTNAKVIRGQVRQVVKEILPEILTTEIQMAIAKTLADNLNKHLAEMHERQKDTLSYLVREVTLNKSK